MNTQTVYDYIADFIASMDPQKILELKAPAAMGLRLEVLIDKEKAGKISAEEKDELEHYIVLERLVRLTKAHARIRMGGQ